MAKQVHVAKDDISQVETVEIELPPLAQGAVRFAVESFSVTANNVTYAVVGDGFGYWNFFPVPERSGAANSGIVPMWGHARVIESNMPEFDVDERVYGYLPMGTHLDVVPGNVSAGGFTAVDEHRAPMSPIYNRYSRLAADPEHDADREGERMIFGPLFKTGFLIEYFLRAQDAFGAGQVVLTSASSKTALGLASVARQNSPSLRRIGLTSAGNLEFVRGTGLYDLVLAYDAIGDLPEEPSISVDFAGNAGVLADLHRHLGDSLKYSCLVGATHIEERGSGMGGAADLPGPKPVLFFAPDHAVTLFAELGPEEAGRQMASAWHAFLEDVDGTVTIDRRKGLDAAREAFVAMVAGKVEPEVGIVIEP